MVFLRCFDRGRAAESLEKSSWSPAAKSSVEGTLTADCCGRGPRQNNGERRKDRVFVSVPPMIFEIVCAYFCGSCGGWVCLRCSWPSVWREDNRQSQHLIYKKVCFGCFSRCRLCTDKPWSVPVCCPAFPTMECSFSISLHSSQWVMKNIFWECNIKGWKIVLLWPLSKSSQSTVVTVETGWGGQIVQVFNLSVGFGMCWRYVWRESRSF